VKKPLKVLIIQKDLFSKIGGGELVYQKIIEKTPDIQFYYFVEGEAANHPRPPNAHVVKLAPPSRVQFKDRLAMGKDFLPLLETADQYAETVANAEFDIVECPDYEVCSYFLPTALEKHRVKYERSVAALHGALSVSVNHAWGLSYGGNPQLMEIEKSYLQNVDGIYGISERYIREVKKKIKRQPHCLDPMNFVEFQRNQWRDKKSKNKPTLLCVGRSEKRKGNDIFVELVRWLDPEKYEKAIHIGPSVRNYEGITSNHFLDALARVRGLEIACEKSKTRRELLELYQNNAMLILPVRYDSFNLTALEALFSGCPVAISNQAGVCDYLDGKYPDLPYIKIDINNLYSAACDISKILDDFPCYQSKLRMCLQKMEEINPCSMQMEKFYQDIIETKKTYSNLSPQPRLGYSKKNHKGLNRQNSGKGLFNTARAMKKSASRKISLAINIFKYLAFYGDKQVAREARKAVFEYNKFVSFLLIPEGSKKLLEEKKSHLLNLEGNRFHRCDLWRVLARLEKALGNESLAAVYGIRVLRHLGDDRFGLLPSVMSSLENAGYPKEAEVALAMYADQSQAEESTHRYLHEAFTATLCRQEKPFELFQDWRSPAIPKVSVIVSLFNAAKKLNLFLTALKQQSLVEAGAVEIILVDSGSPDREKIVLEEFIRTQPMNAVYARSAQRETIQAAWNRGIGLARAPYLVFLGVDETLYPETLELLASELDRSPEVDWVMGDSLVTRVEANGLLKEDVMKYDRTGAGKDHAYLETCYLSWVGGMYRKSIHERFGYYDESFGAAGDTEFKNRILPHIRVKFIPRTLGLLLNYPEGNTTASPRAEIEDLRAWYIHRTVAGVRYAFADRPVSEAENLLALSLGYRKSYCGHLSSDIDYANALAEYLCRRGSLMATTLKADLSWMQDSLCSLETVGNKWKTMPPVLKIIKTQTGFHKKEKWHAKFLKEKAMPSYKIYNDNRYEQHSWLWKGDLNPSRES
jgi:glycosyltransferase involved in cell wall biosynthesis